MALVADQMHRAMCQAETQVESSHRGAVWFRHREVEPLEEHSEKILNMARQETDSHLDQAKITEATTGDSTQ